MAEIGEGSDTTLEEVSEAMENYRITRDRLRPWKALMDVMCAGRLDSDIEDKIGRVVRNWKGDANSVEQDDIWPTVEETLVATQTFHFQIEFPEVFWRENPGFDVIMGNPPWEEATIEEVSFWTRYVPGLKGLDTHERETVCGRLRINRPDLVALFEFEQHQIEQIRASLTSGAFPGMDTGDPDLYKAFCWRFIHLLRNNGRMGVVLPRSAFSAKGSTKFRHELYRSAKIADLTFTKNTRGWVFDEVTPQQKVVFASLKKSKPDDAAVIPIRGPFTSFSAYQNGMLADAISIPMGVIINGSDAATIPLLPTHDIEH